MITQPIIPVGTNYNLRDPQPSSCVLHGFTKPDAMRPVRLRHSDDYLRPAWQCFWKM